MGLAAKVIIAQQEKTAAAEAFTELAAGTGDSLTLANFPSESPAYLEDVWTQVAGGVASVRIRSPRLHDNAQGIRLVSSLDNNLLLPEGVNQILYPGDTLTVEGAGSEAEKALVVAYLVYYTNLPGVEAQLANWAEVQPRIRNIAGVQVSGVKSGKRDWGAGKALTASFNTLKSDAEYAILGYETSVAKAAVRFIGPDTGNLGIGGPAPLDPKVTSSYFVNLSMNTGRPYIPIISSNNAGATLVSMAATTEAEANVTAILAELG